MIENCAIYISDPAMLGSRLFDRSPDIRSYKTFEDKRGVGFKLVLAWGEISCKVMSEANIAHHLNGFEAYMSDKFANEDDLLYFRSRLHYVRTCLGMTITHTEGMDDEVHEFLFSMNQVVAGLMYLHDTVWDWSREALAGALKE
ncbi:MAG: hypothetical protein AAGE52_34055 [Myxococcota bacterium]